MVEHLQEVLGSIPDHIILGVIKMVHDAALLRAKEKNRFGFSLFFNLKNKMDIISQVFYV